ncbi:GNAT family N-acetyltransferase [Dactylosporangium sp. NPDC000244]|uniref:GNAT family N-acetyltransferase n=1 Tax=Dactylosporangium sp. NPDC000244 TaxID=3154365 RepID=UPI003330EF01
MALRIDPVRPDTVPLWREVHNLVIPAHQLSLDEVRERSERNRLTLAHDGGTLVGNATIRPPGPDSRTATVIVRILPRYRRQGLGTQYLDAQLADARALGAERIETVVLAANRDGLEFARRHGFVEFDRYTLDGDDAEYVDLYLT